MTKFVSISPVHDATHRSYFSNSSRTIVLDDVVCLGNETSLSQCNFTHNVSGIGDCNDNEHAGVRCGGVHICTYIVYLHVYM